MPESVDHGLEAVLVADVHRSLLDRASGAGDGIAAAAALVVDELAPVLHTATRRRLAEAVVLRATGLGPLQSLVTDSDVDEIMVCGADAIWIERAGQLKRTELRFSGERELREIVDRMLAPLGRRVDAAQPMCDARLPDGSRVNVTIPPLALDGTTITIRRFRPGGRSMAQLVEAGSCPEELAAELSTAVRDRQTVLVCGSTGSGKTTLLGALSEAIPAGERIITIEDAAELQLRQPHVVRLEARPPNLEGDGAVSTRDLVKNALRMRPDRIVVGEVRGGEALDLLSALSTGHAGGLSTIHAGSAAEALRRLELLALMAGIDLPLAAVRALVYGSIDLIVVQRRAPGGRREIAEVAAVGADGELRPRYLIGDAC